MSPVLTLGSSPTVVVGPLPLAAVLDHHLRRPADQDRVFGTLLGTRSDNGNEVEIKNAFGVPYATKKQGEVTIDIDHHKSLLDLHLRVNPREVVVGWYATNASLNSFSALIHNFFSSESAPHPAIHLTLDSDTLAFAAYTAVPIGTVSRPDHLAFLPAPAVMRVHEHERRGLDLLTSNMTNLSRAAASDDESSKASLGDVSVPSPLSAYRQLLAQVSLMLDQVLEYVNAVASGSRQGDERVGRALLDTIGVVAAPKQQIKTQDKSVKPVEEEFHAHLADMLMVSYLAQVVRTSAEVSSRLSLV